MNDEFITLVIGLSCAYSLLIYMFWKMFERFENDL